MNSAQATDPPNSLPIDSSSAEALSRAGLRMGLVDTSDRAAFEPWIEASSRGFHDPEPSVDSIEERLAGQASTRVTGVWDATAANPEVPVATINSWPIELTVPSGRTVGAWAISSVTVAPTHRRRGIARNLVEADLRTAAALGIPVAAITVSEATIYARFGFAPAAFAANYSINLQRTRWIGPVSPGRVQFVTKEQLAEFGPELLRTARLQHPGDISFEGRLWERIIGLIGAREETRALRFVRFDDETGKARGFAVYRILPSEEDFTEATLDVRYLVSTTHDSYAGLWRFLFDLDLVKTIKAELRPVEEPVRWQVDDARGIRKTAEDDHLWLRIVDAVAALEARSYAAPGTFVLEVTDSLGFADGRFVLDIDGEGLGSARRVGASGGGDSGGGESRGGESRGNRNVGQHTLALTVADLAAVYLGGVSAATLVAAGRIAERTEGAAVALDRSLRSPDVPWLSIWF